MSYPPAPWRMYGHAFVQPYLVDAARLRLPPGFAPIVLAGHALGVLGLIEYMPPSPLTYAELVWMPCLVRVAIGGRRRYGYFVERMYVDDEASLAGGREIWALPKQKARFEIGEGEALIETEDGARLVLELGRRGPSVRAPVGTATLQDAGAVVVRFRGSGTARIGSARLKVREERGLDGWMGWTGARRVHGLGVSLWEFEVTMHEPQRLPRTSRGGSTRSRLQRIFRSPHGLVIMHSSHQLPGAPGLTVPPTAGR